MSEHRIDDSGGIHITFKGGEVFFEVFADNPDGFKNPLLEDLCYRMKDQYLRNLRNFVVSANPKAPDLQVVK